MSTPTSGDARLFSSRPSAPPCPRDSPGCAVSTQQGWGSVGTARGGLGLQPDPAVTTGTGHSSWGEVEMLPSLTAGTLRDSHAVCPISSSDRHGGCEPWSGWAQSVGHGDRAGTRGGRQGLTCPDSLVLGSMVQRFWLPWVWPGRGGGL